MVWRFVGRGSIGFNGHREGAAGELVSGTYFPLLGVGTALGRTFTPDDDRTPDGHPVIMLSYDYWKTRFAGDPSVIGKTLIMNGHNYTIVGVAQKGFDGIELGNTTQVFLPIMMRAQAIPLGGLDFKNRRQRWVNVFGRLKPGVSDVQAKASLQPFFHGIFEMELKEAAFNNASAEVREKFLKNIIDVLPASQRRSYLRRKLTTPVWGLMPTTRGPLLFSFPTLSPLLFH